MVIVGLYYAVDELVTDFYCHDPGGSVYSNDHAVGKNIEAESDVHQKERDEKIGESINSRNLGLADPNVSLGNLIDAEEVCMDPL
jgi:hypothetical protein